MPVTHGQSNPNWTVEETLLALELLQDNDMKVPPRLDPRRIKLVALMQALPLHAPEKRSKTFRNNEGLGMKMYNLLAVEQAPKKGAKGLSTAKMDRHVWRRWAHQQDVVRKLAAQIRADHRLPEFESLPSEATEDEDDETFQEGRLLTRKHRRRERSSKLRKRVLKSRRQKGGAIQCDGCDTGAWIEGDEAAEASMFEVHHLLPLSELGTSKTKLGHVALLCANCHKIIHYLGRTHDSWPDIDALKSVVKPCP